MNKINFIKPVPASKQREVRIWILLCIIAISAPIGNCIITSAIQWQLYRSLQQQKKTLADQLTSFSTIMGEQRKQLEEQQYLQKKLNTIQRYSTNPQNPLPILLKLRKAMHDMALQSVTITTKQFECTIHCTNALQATTSIKRLTQESCFNNIQLISLQTHTNTIIATIKGNITTKLRDTP